MMRVERMFACAAVTCTTCGSPSQAIRVWKESEQQPSPGTPGDDGGATAASDMLSPSASVEEEMNRFFGDGVVMTTQPADKFSDAAPSGAGAVPVWNFATHQNGADSTKPTMVPESYYMSASSLNDLHGAAGADARDAAGAAVRTYADGTTQTISTGDIIATQLFQDK